MLRFDPGRGPLQIKKDKMAKFELTYSILCNDCNATYIGQTKRYSKNRIQEHKDSEKNKIHGKMRDFNYDKTKIVATERQWKK